MFRERKKYDLKIFRETLFGTCQVSFAYFLLKESRTLLTQKTTSGFDQWLSRNSQKRVIFATLSEHWIRVSETGRNLS